MNKRLKEKISEALTSVVPITAIVLALSFTAAPMPVASLMLFLVGAILLIVGVGLFSLGVDLAMMPIGDGVGGCIAKRRIWMAAPRFTQLKIRAWKAGLYCRQSGKRFRFPGPGFPRRL